MRIISMQTGRPQVYVAGNVKPVRTSLRRTRQEGPVFLHMDHLEGDQVTATHVHGGLHKAVNIYASEHYAYWEDIRGLILPSSPVFGENFTTQGWLEEDACIGDVCRVGGAVVQISQPRRPCATLAWHWGIKDFVQVVNSTGRTGWYLRVISEGLVQAGDEITLLERPYPEWSVAHANAVILEPLADLSLTRALADCPALAPAWVDTLTKALGRIQ